MQNELNGCCAFTGHRPQKFPWKYDEEDGRCVALKAVLSQQIERQAASGVTGFFSGMAMGADLWAALAVLSLRERNPAVKLHCVLPCEGQESKWPLSAQALYQSVLEQADFVEYVSRSYHRDCMLDRNRRLVDSAAVLLAVYNGEQRGGTAATVRYARRAGREIILIDPITRQVIHEAPGSGAKA